MTQYYLPDLTGVHPAHLRVNIPYNVYQNGGKIVFASSPVFSHNLRILLVDGSNIRLTENTDYRINADDIDQLAMSQARLQDPAFDKILVRSVTVIAARATRVNLAMNYQEFYLTVPGTLFDDGTPIEVTPDLIKSLVIGLADLRQQVSRVNTPIIGDDNAPLLIPFDLNKENPDNKIIDERVQVNTSTGTRVIRLRQGAYFGDSLVIRLNGATLTPRQDYIPIMTSALTKQTTNKSGIYQFVLLVGDKIGEARIDYHPVGGEVQLDDMTAMHSQVKAIRDYLDQTAFITNTTIVDTPAFRAMHARMTAMENQMRILLTTPVYGDASANHTTRRPIRASDANRHWWDVAKLYKVQGSSDIITADRFKGRIFIPGSKISFTFTADFNLGQPRNPISFSTESLVFDPNYTLLADVDNDAPVYPILRAVWNQNGSAFSGVTLQVGLPLTALSDQLIIEDLSTQESCWLLDRTNEQATGQPAPTPGAPRDNGFLLPDGASTWSEGAANSFVRRYVPHYAKGYLLYSGSNVNLNQLANNANNTALFNTVLPTYFPLEAIESVILTMGSSDGTINYDVEIPLPRFVDNRKAGRRLFSNSVNENQTMSAALTLDGNGKIIIGLNTNFTTATTPDIVRNIRVKV